MGCFVLNNGIDFMLANFNTPDKRLPELRRSISFSLRARVLLLLMSHKHVLSVVLCWAVLAGVRLFLSVSSLMVVSVTQSCESSATQAAFERLLLGVNPIVSLQVHLLRKLFAAYAASELFGLGLSVLALVRGVVAASRHSGFGSGGWNAVLLDSCEVGEFLV